MADAQQMLTTLSIEKVFVGKTPEERWNNVLKSISSCDWLQSGFRIIRNWLIGRCVHLMSTTPDFFGAHTQQELGEQLGMSQSQVNRCYHLFLNYSDLEELKELAPYIPEYQLRLATKLPEETRRPFLKKLVEARKSVGCTPGELTRLIMTKIEAASEKSKESSEKVEDEVDKAERRAVRKPPVKSLEKTSIKLVGMLQEIREALDEQELAILPDEKDKMVKALISLTNVIDEFLAVLTAVESE